MVHCAARIVLGLKLKDIGGLVAVDADDVALAGVDEDLGATWGRGEQAVGGGDVLVGHDGLLSGLRGGAAKAQCRPLQIDALIDGGI